MTAMPTKLRGYVPLWYYALTIVMVAASIFCWNLNRSAAMQALIFFGGGGALYIGLYAFGGVGVTLEASGFTLQTLWRRSQYRWDAVTPFATVKTGGLGGATVVMFETIPPKAGAMAEAARMMTGGYSHALPRNLGRNGRTLAERLNAARDAAIGAL